MTSRWLIFLFWTEYCRLYRVYLREKGTEGPACVASVGGSLTALAAAQPFPPRPRGLVCVWEP